MKRHGPPGDSAGAALTQAVRAAQEFAVEVDGQRTVLYRPLPALIPFHASVAPNLLLSGPRGTGKSLALRMDSHMRAMSKPGLAVLILRRTMPELRKTHLLYVEQEAKLLGATFLKQESVLKYANGSVSFYGHCEGEADVLKYLSTQWAALYIDELTTFPEDMALKLMASVRTDVDKGIIAVVRCGTNPLGVGAGWVKKYYIDKQVPENFEYVPDDYQVIFQKRDDNKHVDWQQYDKRLSALPAHIRAAWREGEWTVEGAAFPEWREHDDDGKPWHVIEELPTYRRRSILDVKWIKVVASVDWGYAAAGNPGVCIWFAMLADGTAIAFDEYVFRETLPADAAREIARRNSQFNMAYTVCDPAMAHCYTGESIMETFARNGVSMIEGDNERIPGWMQVHAWLIEIVDDGTGKRPRLRFLRKGQHRGRTIGCTHTIRTVPTCVIDKNHPMDLETKGVEDDSADVVRYWAMSRVAPSQEPKEDLANREVRDFIAKRRARQKNFAAGMR